MTEKSLAGQARELLEKLSEVQGTLPYMGPAIDVRELLKAVLTVLELAESNVKRDEWLKTVPKDTNSRTLALAQMALKLYQYAPSAGDTIVGSHDNGAERVKWAVDKAEEIMREAEKRNV